MGLLACPADVVIHLCTWLDLDEIENMMVSCRAMQNLLSPEFYWYVAILHWGAVFWQRALTRRTRKRFTCMHSELHQIHRFQKKLRDMNCDAWTHRDFYEYWRCEEAFLTQKNRQNDEDGV